MILLGFILRHLRQSIFIVLLSLAAIGCASGPAPAPVVEGVNLKTYSETKWKVWLDLDPAKLQPQESQELCWAACVRAIQLHTLGESLEQKELHAKHILTLPQSQREVGYEGEIVDAMAGGYREQFQERYVIDLNRPADLTNREIIVSLSGGQPVLFAMGSSANSAEGHIAVIYGVQYEEVEVSIGDQIVDGATSIGSDIATWGGGLFGDDPERKSSAIEASGEQIDVIADATDGREYRLTKVYVWDPANDFDGDGKIDGGMKIYSTELFEQVKDFTLSQVSALELTQEKLVWLKRFEPGAGVFVRNPLDRMGDPAHRSTVEGFDAGVVVDLNQRFGITSDKQREEAQKKDPQLQPKP